MDEKRDEDRYSNADPADRASGSGRYPPEGFFNWLADATRSHELQDYLRGGRAEEQGEKNNG